MAVFRSFSQYVIETGHTVLLRTYCLLSLVDPDRPLQKFQKVWTVKMNNKEKLEDWPCFHPEAKYFLPFVPWLILNKANGISLPFHNLTF